MRCVGFLSAGLVGVVLSSTSVWQAFSQATEKQSATGTVTGRVFCDDTNAPARLARVMLEPVSDVSDAVAHEGRPHLPSGDAGSTESEAPRMVTFQTKSVQTGLDGSVTMKNVKPGVYYVIAEMPGYLSPLSTVGNEDWRHPTTAVADRMAKMLQRVSVDAGRTTAVNVALERGASISGTVNLDDGSPAAAVSIKAMREKSDGSWETVRLVAIQWVSAAIQTDDLGRYRLAGLPAGKYVIEADLSLRDISASALMGTAQSTSEWSRYSLSFFTGGYLRARADAAFALTKGESRNDEDLVIPLSKLHSISGTVVASHDGHPLGGIVQLL